MKEEALDQNQLSYETQSKNSHDPPGNRVIDHSKATGDDSLKWEKDKMSTQDGPNLKKVNAASTESEMVVLRRKQSAPPIYLCNSFSLPVVHAPPNTYRLAF